MGKFKDLEIQRLNETEEREYAERKKKAMNRYTKEEQMLIAITRQTNELVTRIVHLERRTLALELKQK